MTYINVNEQYPGIRSLLDFRPEIAKPLGALANVLLREGTPGLQAADRELIGAHVSYLNDCFYCRHSHAAIACEYLDGQQEMVESVVTGKQHPDITPKMAALLTIAASVQRNGKEVTQHQVDQARNQGATDLEIHDTVLIAALFCLFNRYVDGLSANTPQDLSTYPTRAKEVVAHGYRGPQRETNSP
ncbi:MAG: carboxymuconolactone decarboxylase family protein [Chitinophagaceae bacterium]|nr:MAG: carboxymuconolactone decarboxylase family protein [Chitinophagaceae bacterium]